MIYDDVDGVNMAASPENFKKAELFLEYLHQMAKAQRVSASLSNSPFGSADKLPSAACSICMNTVLPTPRLPRTISPP